MKRYIFLLIALITLSVSAQNVSKEQARQTAMKFLKEAGVQSKLAPQPAKAPAVNGASVEAPLYYVFNAEDGKAFAIVSAVHNEVLGYSSTHALDTESMPEAMAWYIETAAINGVIKSSAKGRRSVAQIVTTEWGQGSDDLDSEGNIVKRNFRYNAECPIDPAVGLRCLTGCVPVALGQIMTKWKHPAKLHKTIPGYTSHIGEQDIALDPLQPISFNWEIMKNKYEFAIDNPVDDHSKAVTSLLKYLGWASRVDYGVNSTGTSDYEAEAALNMYFDYYGKIHWTLSDAQKEEIAYNEVSSNRPLYFAGENKRGRHAFVIDGYKESNSTFRINWGWNGNNNAWFYLYQSGNCNPVQEFTDLTCCIVGIVPKTMIEKINLIDKTIKLSIGKSHNINLYTSPYSLPKYSFTYAPMDENIATVDEFGKITAISPGETDIVVSLGYLGVMAMDKSRNYSDCLPIIQQVHVVVTEGDVGASFENMNNVDKHQLLNNSIYNENTWGVSNSDLDANGDGVVDANDGNALKEDFVNGTNGSMTEGGTFAGGYEYVDLGLPSGNKWATKNVGAATPEDAGYYFAWGEATTKNKYLPETSYTYQKNSESLILCGMAKEVNGRLQFTKTYDAAAQIWCGNWSAPTAKDMQELTEKCDWYWERLNGEYGYRVVGPNGNTIFLPAGGRKNLSTEFLSENGCYWLNDASMDEPTSASGLYFTSSQYNILTPARFHGFNMRAVIRGEEDTDADDVVASRTYNGKTYVIKYKSDMNDIRYNPDGTEFYRTSFYLDLDGKKVEIPEDFYVHMEQTSNWDKPCVAVDLVEGKSYFFVTSKTPGVDYGMYGNIYVVNSNGSIETIPVYDYANWGWFPYFEYDMYDGMSLNFFSFAGYYGVRLYIENGLSGYSYDCYPGEFEEMRSGMETIYIRK